MDGKLANCVGRTHLWVVVHGSFFAPNDWRLGAQEEDGSQETVLHVIGWGPELSGFHPFVQNVDVHSLFAVDTLMRESAGHLRGYPRTSSRDRGQARIKLQMDRQNQNVIGAGSEVNGFHHGNGMFIHLCHVEKLMKVRDIFRDTP